MKTEDGWDIVSLDEYGRGNKFLEAKSGDEWLGELGSGGAIPLLMYN